MLIAIPQVLDPEAVAHFRETMAKAEWRDGNETSGAQSALAKNNLQLPEDSEAARYLGGKVLDALGRSPLFVAAALPLKVFPPLFNRYEGGGTFATHIDNAIRIKRGSDFRIRSDLSATLFLSDPEGYDGGELVIEGQFGDQSIKLGAGDMVLYPASNLHHVNPVTRGTRLASFFWVQSLVRDNESRRILFELDCSIQSLVAEMGNEDARVIQLTGIYHNLLRKWADA
jgi:PKHD-type hydroxylase